MSEKRNLFDENSDDEEGDLDLTINKDYAQRYEEWREAEIKRKLEDKYANADDLSSSSSDDTDDDPEELKKVLSKDFFELISSIKTRDPKIYNPEVQFFKNEKAQSGLDPVEKMRKKKGGNNQPVFLRDFERKLITERGGKFSDDDSDCEEKHKRSHSPTFVEEERQIKESFKKAIKDDDSDEEGDLLKKKDKTKEEKEKDEEEYIQWLKGEKKDLADKKTEESLKPLQNLWNDPKLDEGEKFLRDYVLNKRYIEKGDEPLDTGNVSDEDFEDEYMNQFERKFNFRFEEPDREFLKRYPRTMEQSLRKKDTRRKEKREAVKLRKEEEKKRKREELKVLKALKRKEILKKIEKIKEITGNEELGLIPEELEEDFDPDAHDRKMRELFNDDYYGGADDAEDEDGLNLPPLEEDDLYDDNVDWDEWDGTDRNAEETQVDEGTQDTKTISAEGYCEDTDFNMDCDYDPAAEALRKEEKTSGRKSAREKRKLKRQSRFGKLVRKEKPVFDPNDKTFDQYVDEYYGMDYEDLIGDIHCRFKYKSVIPNSFGLTIDEILAADDKELNQWASIKKAYTIRSDQVENYEAKVYAQKAQNEELKRKILPSLYKHEAENNFVETEGKKRKKKKRHLEEYESEQVDNMDFTEKFSDQAPAGHGGSTVSDKKEKKKKKSEAQQDDSSLNMDSVEEIQDQEVNKESSKKKKRGMLEIETEDANKEAGSHHTNAESPVSAIIKKKKKNVQNSSENDTRVNGAKTEECVNEISMSKKLKSKKRKYEENSQSPNPTKKIARESHKGGSSKRKEKWNQRQQTGHRNQEMELSDDRLRAYGIKPKQFKNKMKYGARK